MQTFFTGVTLSILALSGLAAPSSAPIPVPSLGSHTVAGLSAYVSLSIELLSFPLFAGNKTSPNVYSINLLENIGNFQGDMPVIRVGGNSQDRAIYDATLTTPTNSTCATDPSAILCIGPSFFSSYGTFPATKYSHGFNLAANNISGALTIDQTVPLACKAIGPALEVWELGNEPDLYRGKWRPANWNESSYVAEWLNGTSRIRTLLQKSCPHLPPAKFMAPSFSSSGSALSQVLAFQDGLNAHHDIAQISLHNYITGATSPGVTLQSTLLNHSVTAASLDKQSAAASSLSSIPAPFILGELNSLYGGGAAGLSDTFGAGLWTMDFTLYAASTGNIKRLHFHQSNGAAYSAWSPVASGGNPPATHPPYYGKLAAARFLGRSDATSVVGIPLSSDLEAAYAAYEGGRLVRIAVLNMRAFNSTETAARPTVTYSFAVSGARKGSSWAVERLTAAGSDAKTGLSFGGYAYEYGTLGKAAKIAGVASGESAITVANGVVSVQVSDSEAVVLSLS